MRRESVLRITHSSRYWQEVNHSRNSWYLESGEREVYSTPAGYVRGTAGDAREQLVSCARIPEDFAGVPAFQGFL